MTDTELILSKIEDLRTELKADIKDVRTEMSDLRTELKADIEDVRIELGGKITAVQLALHDLRDHLDVVEYGLQTEIEKTYDLALKNEAHIKMLIPYKNQIAERQRAKIRLISDAKKRKS